MHPRTPAVAASLAVALLAAQAHADDDPMSQCIAASEKGLDLRKQGKLLEARGVLAACAAATTCGPDISSVCQKRIAEISATLPSIVFLPKDAAGNDVAGVKVTIDDAAAGASGASGVLDGRPIVLDPGNHTFKFEFPGHPPVERSFVLLEGAKDRQERVDLVPPAPPPSPVASSVGAHGAEGAPSGSGQRTAALVVGGVGVLGVAAGTVFGLLASSKWSDSKNECGSSSSLCLGNRAQAVSDHDAAATDATVSTVAFAAGGAAIAAGAFLFFTAPHGGPETSKPEGHVALVPILGPSTAGLSAQGVFR
jgi:hypothetical protein